MNFSKYFAVFCVEALYYLPHFLPVADEMKRRGIPHAWFFSKETKKSYGSIIDNLKLHLINEPPEKMEGMADFFIFGNGYNNLVSVSGVTVLIYHGIGTKACYYDHDLDKFHIRFIEGEYRKKELDIRSKNDRQERPIVGFSKLDPAVSLTSVDRDSFLRSLKLDPTRKTVLYAPTYYPSSIEHMDRNFPEDCSTINVIVKPHQFTYSSRYKKQCYLLNSWGKSQNVFLARQSDFNILPFFQVSDVMISDESSAIFEFAALKKPVIRNRFVKIRFSYRLFPWKLQRRMDTGIERYSGIARNAHNYKEMIRILRDELESPSVDQYDIIKYTRDLLGDVDGKASERIVDYLLSYQRH